MLGKHPHRVAGLWHLVTLLVPMVLVLIALRVLLTPGYLHVAYRLPGFPADPYGFDLDDRLRWAEKARQYLMWTSVSWPGCGSPTDVPFSTTGNWPTWWT